MSNRKGGLGPGGLGNLIPQKPVTAATPPKAAEQSSTAPSTPAPATNTNGTSHDPSRKSTLLTVPITSIIANPYQPRRHIDPTELAELADSIRANGILQPPVVSTNPDYEENYQPAKGDDDELIRRKKARYVLIAGERRWQASKLVGLVNIPVVLKETTQQQMLELALIENIQRSDLNPLEEALAYRQLLTEFKLRQEDVAQKVGKSRSAVTNSLRLLELPEKIQEALNQGLLTEGHARALLAVRDKKAQLQLSNEVVNKQLSVRQTEELARRINIELLTKGPIRELTEREQGDATVRAANQETRDLEDQFRKALGVQTALTRSKKGGKLVITFNDDDQLDAIYQHIVGGI